MKKIYLIRSFALLAIILTAACKKQSSALQDGAKFIPNQFLQLKTIDEDGLLCERVDLWRNNRLWYIAESGFLIDGFENRPGEHLR